MSIGQVLYDNIKDPKKRYFLEKRWGFNGNILGAIMMNPSRAGGIENDSTVERLIKYAKKNEYVALYIINIIPIINSKSSELKGLSDNEVIDEKQAECFKYVLNKADLIYLGWGKTGQKYFNVLLNENNLKQDFIKNSHKFRATAFKEYPYHPIQINPAIPKLEENTLLKDISSDIKKLIY